MEKKNKTMLGVVIGLLVVMLGTIVGLGIYIVNSMGKETAEAATHQEVVVIDHADLKELPSYEVTTNLADGSVTDKNGGKDSGHMLKLVVGLNINYEKDKIKDADKLILVLTEKETTIKDIIISVVSTKTYEELKEIGAKDRIKEEILRKLQDEFQTNLIVSVKLGDWKLV